MAKFRVLITNRSGNSCLDNNGRSTGGCKNALLGEVRILLKATQQVKKMKTSGASCSGQNRAIVQGVPLPKINLFPSLPTEAQRFSRFHQSLQDFHQPLHGLIRRLREFLQPLKEANRSLLGVPAAARLHAMILSRVLKKACFKKSTLKIIGVFA
jgi:hypothetical protein